MRQNNSWPALSFVLALTTVPVPVLAQHLQGPASVADGDSLSVSGIRVRLFGIDAPELAQNCYDGETVVACGEMAKAQLQAMIGSSQVSCSGKSTDSFGRMVAVCRIGNLDLGLAMVEAGWATAYRNYSDVYVPAETRARALRTGLWQWTFQPPEDFRSAQETREAPSSANRVPHQRQAGPVRRWERDAQCLIKGNRNRKGEWIYHLPGMPYYDATRAEEYFCTEADARAAGYRRAIVR